MVAFFALVISALVAFPAVLSERVAPNALFARQISSGLTPGDIPSQCVSPCAVLTETFTGDGSCMDLSCLCTDTIATGLDTCLSCALQANVDGLNQTVVDDSIDGFIDACEQGGFSVTDSAPDSSNTGSGAPTGGSGGASPATAGGNGGSASSPATGGAAAATQTSPSGTGNTLGGKSAAVTHSMSIVGVVFAAALAVSVIV